MIIFKTYLLEQISDFYSLVQDDEFEEKINLLLSKKKKKISIGNRLVYLAEDENYCYTPAKIFSARLKSHQTFRDKEIVSYYVEELENGNELDPIIVSLPDKNGNFLILDGNHKYCALKELGVLGKTLTVRVKVPKDLKAIQKLLYENAESYWESSHKFPNLFKKITTSGIDLWRGTPERPTDKQYQSDPGDFGRGIYYTSNKARARQYGKNLQKVRVTFQNPLILSEEEAYEKLTDKYGTVTGYAEMPNYGAGDMNRRMRQADRLTRDLLALGYDGLVTVNGPELEVVDYRPYK